MKRMRWTDAKVSAQLLHVAEAVGRRMPTASELRERGRNALVCRVQRTGGFDRWAQRLGLDVKRDASRKGWVWERWFVAEAARRGMDVKPRDGVKSPFDATCSGHTVDVKSAEFADAHWAGWSFHIHNKCVPDFLVLVCLRDDDPERVYVVPGDKAPRTMVSIVEGRSKYAPYLGRWDDLL